MPLYKVPYAFQPIFKFRVIGIRHQDDVVFRPDDEFLQDGVRRKKFDKFFVVGRYAVEVVFA